MNAMQTFYGTPTPANAIRLALADHAAHCAPMTPQSEYTRELNRALERVEAHAGLVTALRNMVQARDAVRASVQHFHKNRAQVKADADAAKQARALLAKLGEL